MIKNAKSTTLKEETESLLEEMFQEDDEDYYEEADHDLMDQMMEGKDE